MPERLTPTELLELTKKHFLDTFAQKEKPIYSYLPQHVHQVATWAERILTTQPEANSQVVRLAVWLHDIGHVLGQEDTDHAVKSEVESKRFLTENGLDTKTIEAVAHCVRAHRNRDIPPSTPEAKIIAAADSASHFTDINYIIHCQEGIKTYALEKLERDYRDVGLISGLQEQLTPLYQAWKQLLAVFPETKKD
jgi:predicted metal-dependent HD superfamily phosphohydrolase